MKKYLTTAIILTLSCLFGAWELGYVEPLFTEDQTYITYLITVLWTFAVGSMYWKKWDWVNHISGVLPSLGLLGTLIGLKLAIGGSVGEDYSLRDLGVYSAINTTIVGIVGSIYLDSLMKVLRREEE